MTGARARQALVAGGRGQPSAGMPSWDLRIVLEERLEPEQQPLRVVGDVERETPVGRKASDTRVRSSSCASAEWAPDAAQRATATGAARPMRTPGIEPARAEIRSPAPIGYYGRILRSQPGRATLTVFRRFMMRASVACSPVVFLTWPPSLRCPARDRAGAAAAAVRRSDLREGRRADRLRQVRQRAIARARWRRCRCSPTRGAARGRAPSRARWCARDAAVGRRPARDACRCATTSACRKQQIQTIAAWVDAGAPQGNVADLPPAPTFATGWTYGREPDYILEMPVEFDIPAEGELGVQMFYSKVPWTEDRFAEVVELRPGNAQGRAPRRHLLRRHPGRRDAGGRPHRRAGRQGDRRPRIAAACRPPKAACPGRASCCRGCPAAASIGIARTSASASPPASTSTGRCTTTRPASPRRTGRASASGSTRCR